MKLQRLKLSSSRPLCFRKKNRDERDVEVKVYSIGFSRFLSFAHHNGINKQTRELISIRKLSHEDNTDLSEHRLP